MNINKCPKCNDFMERRKHNFTKKKTNKSHYFSEWDYCKKCNHVQFYEKYKVFYKDVPETLDVQESLFSNPLNN